MPGSLASNWSGKLWLETKMSATLYIGLTSKLYKVSKGAKIRNRYNQVPHLTQDTNGKETNS